MPRPARPHPLVTGAAGALLALAAGCTFLVSFEDKPSAASPDGGPAGAADASEPARVPPPDAEQPPPPPADSGLPSPDLAKCDPDFDRAAIKGCERFEENALVCGDNAAFTGYPPSERARDVVACSKIRGVLCVQHCASTCAHLPQGFPDQCDDCGGKPDGLYCGLEMTGWPQKNFNLLVRCTEGRFAPDPPPRSCANGCDPIAAGDARCL